MQTYNFTALCKSGEWKSTSFQASNYKEARKLLDQFIANN